MSPSDNEEIQAYVDMIVMHSLKPSHHSSWCADPKHIKKRTPPPVSWLCLNVDAAIFSSSPSSAVGVIARDHIGRCLMGCHQYFSGITMPVVAEALALWCAMVFAFDEDFHKVIMQPDCLSIIQDCSC